MIEWFKFLTKPSGWLESPKAGISSSTSSLTGQTWLEGLFEGCRKAIHLCGCGFLAKKVIVVWYNGKGVGFGIRRLESHLLVLWSGTGFIIYLSISSFNYKNRVDLLHIFASQSMICGNIWEIVRNADSGPTHTYWSRTCTFISSPGGFYAH